MLSPPPQRPPCSGFHDWPSHITRKNVKLFIIDKFCPHTKAHIIHSLWDCWLLSQACNSRSLSGTGTPVHTTRTSWIWGRSCLQNFQYLINWEDEHPDETCWIPAHILNTYMVHDFHTKHSEQAKAPLRGQPRKKTFGFLFSTCLSFSLYPTFQEDFLTLKLI